jgi:hypothetical protein
MSAPRLKVIATLVVACALLGAGCQTPTGPTTGAASQPVTLGILSPSESQLAANAVGLSPEDFAARGWACRPVPSNPAWTQCSRPHQGFPVIPPPDDRPATYNFLLWDGADFLGQVLLIRSDLYRGQTCQSTGQPYRFIALVGYYECLHPAGA